MIARLRLGLLCVTLGLGLPSQAAHPDRGRLLYENYCYHCHMTEIHFRARSKVRSAGDLRRRVRVWMDELQLNWSREDLMDVAAYLNIHYYRFPSTDLEGQ